MQKMSDKMKKSLQSSHMPITYVGVVSINGKHTYIPIESGSVSVDRTSQDIRRTINFTTSKQELVPLLNTDPLQIYGNHVFAYRGVLWNRDGIDPGLWEAPLPLSKEWLKPANGAYEMVPLGVFRINSVDIAEDTDGDLKISVDGSDISANIAKNHWTNPVSVWTQTYDVPVSPTDTTPEKTYIASTTMEAIRILIQDRWPAHNVFGPPQFDFSGVADKNLKKAVVMGSQSAGGSGSNSPWTDITGLATAVNAELFVGADGAFTLRTLPDPNTIPPSWEYLDGEGGLLLGATRKLSDSKAVNYVVATAESAGATVPLRSVAADTDPSSPTYYLGTFGRVVAMESGRKKLINQQEVDLAARTYLNWFVGGDEAVVIKGVCNPALDTGDVVSVRRQKLGIFDSKNVKAQLVGNLADDTEVSTLIVRPLQHKITAGSTLLLITNLAQQQVVVSENASVGDTQLHVKAFTTKHAYYRDSILCDPKHTTNGSVNYYIDKLEIPLDLESPTHITARERRVGTKQDAIRVAEYSQ